VPYSGLATEQPAQVAGDFAFAGERIKKTPAYARSYQHGYNNRESIIQPSQMVACYIID